MADSGQQAANVLLLVEGADDNGERAQQGPRDVFGRPGPRTNSVHRMAVTASSTADRPARVITEAASSGSSRIAHPNPTAITSTAVAILRQARGMGVRATWYW